MVRVTPAIKDQRVDFTVIDDNVRTNFIGADTTGSDGYAEIMWTGAPLGSSRSILVEARIGDRREQREIQVRPVSISSGRTLTVIPTTTDVTARGAPHWYEERQLPHRIVARIKDYAGRCEDNVVAFRPVGSTAVASPDTVRAQAESGDCVARASWRLGKGVGWQHLQVSLTDEPSIARNVSAIARALPRIGAGLAVSYDNRTYPRLKLREDTVQVIYRLPGDSIIVKDSVVNRASIDTTKAEASVHPTVNVDFPLVLRWRHLRGSLAVSLLEPDRDWYAGVSILHPFIGLTPEKLGVDVHLMVHFGRRDVLRNPTCNNDGNIKDCDVDDTFRVMGGGFIVVVDGNLLPFASLGAIFK
jgi:hypothetical protein